jgi:hypothetical protein
MCASSQLDPSLHACMDHITTSLFYVLARFAWIHRESIDLDGTDDPDDQLCTQ